MISVVPRREEAPAHFTVEETEVPRGHNSFEITYCEQVRGGCGNCLQPLSLFLFFFFFNYFILEYRWFNNVVLVSNVQQNESVIHIHITTLLRFFSYIGYYRILSSVSCAIQ